ncbi:MAG: hypothetical protein U1F54_12100 [Burkholderiales bacterium]
MQRFERTPKGQLEISQGKKSLPAKLRTVLFLVDPAKDPAEIQRQVALMGAPATALAELAEGGYIAPVRAFNAPIASGGEQSIEDQLAQFRVAKAFMNETIVDALGIRAFMFTLKLEKCATAADLATLLPDYAQALLKKLDREAVRAMVERTRELLAAAGAKPQ